MRDKIWLHKSKKECRWFLHWGRAIWRYEGYLFKNANHTCIALHLGGEENDFTFSLGIKGLFTFYFGSEGVISSKLNYKLFGYDGRHYGVSLFDEYLRLEFHRDDAGYSKKWEGIHLMINWKKMLFGKEKYTSEVLSTSREIIEMPEGNYHATVKESRCTWTRKRLLKPIIITRYEITPDIPIPEPGKGENSWDIDDDATYSSTVQANSIDEALLKVADSVMKTRISRVGKNWRPSGGFLISSTNT